MNTDVTYIALVSASHDISTNEKLFFQTNLNLYFSKIFLKKYIGKVIEIGQFVNNSFLINCSLFKSWTREKLELLITSYLFM